MSKTLVLSVLVILAIFLCSVCSQPKRSTRFKVNEIGRSPTFGVFCGDMIVSVYKDVCRSHKRQGRSLLLPSNDAKVFLQKRSSSHQQSSYNIVEECCVESCAIEEVKEYC